MEKARIQEVVDGLPEKVDVDELIERLYLLQRLELAEEELAAGKVVDHEDVGDLPHGSNHLDDESGR